MHGIQAFYSASITPASRREQLWAYLKQLYRLGRKYLLQWAHTLRLTWQATITSRPILPVAASFTVGVMLARWEVLSEADCMLLGIALLIVALLKRGEKSGGAKVWLLIGMCLLAGTMWFLARTRPSSDDVRHIAPPQGTWTRMRMKVLELCHVPAREEPLRPWTSQGHTTGLARAEAVLIRGDWRPCRGMLRVTFRESVPQLAAGDRIEAFGELVAVLPPGNPGEDHAGFSDHARGIGARFFVRAVQDNCRLLLRAPWYELTAHLARLQDGLQQRLREALPADVSGLAQALLLGDMTQLEPEHLWRYQRTGVIHVLAISGQHLVILCGFVLGVGRLLKLTRRRLAWGLIALVWCYAGLTGARPATVRAAVMVTCWCLALRWHRPTEAVNFLALAWLILGVWDPRDWFDLGCQLSFLSALVLYVAAPPLSAWLQREHPLDRLEPTSFYRLLKRACVSWLGTSLLVGAVIWLVLTPWLASRVHLVTPSSIWMTPVVVPFASVALICGMAFLIGGWIPGLADVLAWTVTWPLRITETLLACGEQVPGAYIYTPGPAVWWLVGFYLPILAWLLLPGWLSTWRRVWGFALVWGLFGYVVSLVPQSERGLELAFLEVGHGCCVVVETPDGRVWLYDAGSLQGPDITDRVIAPYLWSRGHRKLDGVVLSHCDLDHYNGLPRLIELFRVGAVYVNPSFWQKDSPATLLLRKAVHKHGVPVYSLDNTACATTLMDRLAPHIAHEFPERAPDSGAQVGQVMRDKQVTVEVLHPPSEGLCGSENARSLVLLLRYAERNVLLSGDLEEPGLAQVLGKLPKNIDVMWAPHHGAAASNTRTWAETCRPGLVIIGCARQDRPAREVYEAIGATVWETWYEGAVLVAINRQGIRAQTHRTHKSWQR
ncbi:MAG: ComEC/Rec2 family competence protein [Gemmatales bacterium]|nr:ComEC/Rec2 family competence protein [Gemmatales bacterium]